MFSGMFFRVFPGMLAAALAGLTAAGGARPARAADDVGIVVSAAASLSDAFRDVKAAWLKEHPGHFLALNLAASGVLQVQIARGAPADVFASAGLEPMRSLVDRGLVDSGEVRIFARNRLVLVAPEEPSGTDTAGIRYLVDLARPRVRRIAIGNEETVPAGRYAAQTLRRYSLYGPVEAKLVPAENVRQVLEYVAQGAADAGFVYATDVTIGVPVRVVYEVPESAHEPILYPIAPINTSERLDEAREFVGFVCSPAGRAALLGRGFLPPDASEPDSPGPMRRGSSGSSGSLGRPGSEGGPDSQGPPGWHGSQGEGKEAR